MIPHMRNPVIMKEENVFGQDKGAYTFNHHVLEPEKIIELCEEYGFKITVNEGVEGA